MNNSSPSRPSSLLQGFNFQAYLNTRGLSRNDFFTHLYSSQEITSTKLDNWSCIFDHKQLQQIPEIKARFVLLVAKIKKGANNE